jgi:hypothetical protein
MLPLYSRHRLGAGCIKTQMAFGAWAGCALPFPYAQALIATSTIGGLLFTYFVLRMVVAEKEPDELRRYDFPAQATISAVTAVSALAIWAMSSAL